MNLQKLKYYWNYDNDKPTWPLAVGPMFFVVISLIPLITFKQIPEIMSVAFLVFGMVLNLRKDQKQRDVALYAWSVSSGWGLFAFSDNNLWMLFAIHACLIVVQMREYFRRRKDWSKEQTPTP